MPRSHAELSTKRLLTLQWLDGEKLLEFESAPPETRDAIAAVVQGVVAAVPALRRHPRRPASRQLFRRRERRGRGATVEAVNLFDYGCVRIFPPRFVEGVVELYRALESQRRGASRHAYELWGFKGLTSATIEAMNIWARSSAARSSTTACAASPTA